MEKHYQDELQKMIQEDQNEIERLREQNAAWKQEFDALIGYKATATQLEKEGKLMEAIQAYSNAVYFGESSKLLQVHNYAHDINRLIILFSKTKQKAVLICFLKQIIAKYPNFPDKKNWSERLYKLERSL